MSFLFFETWGIGDVLQMLPVILSIKKKIPSADVSLVTRQENLLPLIPPTLVDSIFVIREPGRWGVLKYLWRRRRQKYSLVVLNFRASILVKAFFRLMGNRKIIGGCRIPFLGVRASGKHQVLEVSEGLWEDVGFETPEEIRLEIPPGEKVWAEEYLRSHELCRDPLLAIHLGSGVKQKFKRIPMTLAEAAVEGFQKMGFSIIVIEGPQDGDSPFGISETSSKKIVVMPPSTLARVAAVLARVQVTVSGDSGIGHLSAAVGTPVVSLFGPTDAVRTRPWGAKNQVVQAQHRPSCQPCNGNMRSRFCVTRECLEKIDVTEVASRAWQISQNSA